MRFDEIVSIAEVARQSIERSFGPTDENRNRQQDGASRAPVQPISIAPDASGMNKGTKKTPASRSFYENLFSA